MPPVVPVLRSLSHHCFDIGPVLIKPKVGAKLGVLCSGPGSLKTSHVIGTMTTVTRCGYPLVIVSLKATAAFYIVSRGKGCLNKTITPKVDVSVRTLFRQTSGLPHVRLLGPGSVVYQGAISTVRTKVCCNFIKRVSRVIAHVGTRVGQGSVGIVTANNLTALVTNTSQAVSEISSVLALGNLLVLCRGGGKSQGPYVWGVLRVSIDTNCGVRRVTN